LVQSALAVSYTYHGLYRTRCYNTVLLSTTGRGTAFLRTSDEGLYSCGTVLCGHEFLSTELPSTCQHGTTHSIHRQLSPTEQQMKIQNKVSK